MSTVFADGRIIFEDLSKLLERADNVNFPLPLVRMLLWYTLAILEGTILSVKHSHKNRAPFTFDK